MDNTKATEYLQNLLNKKFRVYTNDSRMFYGDFKCTDNVSHPVQDYKPAVNVFQECNIILSQSYEYRQPTANAVQAAAESPTGTSSTETLKVDMTSRFLGLIVVPGQYITKIEVEDLSVDQYTVPLHET